MVQHTDQMAGEWWSRRKEETCKAQIRDPQELVPAWEGVGGRETHAGWDRTGLGLDPIHHGELLGFRAGETHNHLWFRGRGPVALCTMAWRPMRLIHSANVYFHPSTCHRWDSPVGRLSREEATPQIWARKGDSSSEDRKESLGDI